MAVRLLFDEKSTIETSDAAPLVRTVQYVDLT
jgi:hypothetical protein